MDKIIDAELSIPQVNETQAYGFGHDCGINGPSVQNCHFSIFMQWQNTRAWEKGLQDAKDKLSDGYQADERA